MKLLDQYNKAEDAVLAYFGLSTAVWNQYKLDDKRKYYWSAKADDSGIVSFADTKEELKSQSGQYYEVAIHTIHHGADFTLIKVWDNGEYVAMVFDNAKKIRKIRKP